MLTILALTLLQALSPINVSDLSAVRRIPLPAAEGIVAAVNADEELPLLGSKKDEALLVAIYMKHESFFKLTARGDHGLSLGPMQLQRVSAAVAFNYEKSVAEWLRRAHASASDCASLPEEEELSELASGNCGHGHIVARTRARQALILARSVEPVESLASDDVGRTEAFLPKE